MAFGDVVFGKLARVLSRHGSILCLHGIRGSTETESVMNVTLSKAMELIDVARAAATIVPLSDLHARWVRGLPHAGLVAITFDDAYVSLLQTASSWYCRAPFPATVFVVAGASRTGGAYWWDRLEAISPLASLSDRLSLEAAVGVPDHLRGGSDPVFGAWRTLRQWLLREHAGRPPEAFGEQLTSIESRLQTSTLQRAMTIGELHELARLGPVAFGVHTAEHPVLPLLPDEDVVSEIRTTWNALRDWELPAPTPYLAAPFGLYDKRTATLAMEAGMSGVVGLQESVLLSDESSVMPRWTLVSAMTSARLALRISGVHGFLRPRGRSGPPEVS